MWKALKINTSFKLKNSKKIKFISLIFFVKSMVVILTFLNLSSSIIYKESSSYIIYAKDKNEKTYNLTIEGMTCTGCESAIKKSVKKLNGIKDIEPDYKTGKGTVKFDEKQVNINDIIKSIEKLGYKVIKYEEVK